MFGSGYSEDLYMSERYRRSSASISTEVHETADRLEQRGDDVFPKFRNGFKVTSSVSGARIAGRPEIVAYHVDGSVTVDVSRSGEPEAADDVRDRLCMYPPAQVQPRPVAREQNGRLRAVWRRHG